MQRALPSSMRSWPLMTPSKKFIIAPTDFTPESGELTPTLKVKRKVVTQQYQAQLDRLYAGRLACGRIRLTAWPVPRRRASGTSRPTHDSLRRSCACRNAGCAARPLNFLFELEGVLHGAHDFQADRVLRSAQRPGRAILPALW